MVSHQPRHPAATRIAAPRGTTATTAPLLLGRARLRLRGMRWKERHEKEIAAPDLLRVDVLKAGLDTAKPDFAPKDDSGLLKGGESPSDSFFTKAEFIGAIGAEDWTKGNWMKITKFAVPAE